MDSEGIVASVTVIAVIVTVAIHLLVVPTQADPPNSTDHGISDDVFPTLWAGDEDVVRDSTNNESGSAVAALANGTDIPLDSPPPAVEHWNRGDHGEFPATNRSVSIHPPDTQVSDEEFIRDAYTEIFAVQPSTRARISETRHPLYVAPNGTLLGTVDYRVVVPAGNSTTNRTVQWTLEEHRIVASRLLADGNLETNATGSHTPSLSYTLTASGGETHRLTLETEITAELREEIETCAAYENGSCTAWNTSVENHTETVTVTDSVEVTDYDLSVSGFVGRYPNGDLGLVVHLNQPWLGYSVPAGDVRGVWRFYAARDPEWDRIVYSTDAGDSTSHSPMHPLQVCAFPIETGPTATPRSEIMILEVAGEQTNPASLPAAIHLDRVDRPYTASFGIATRTATDQTPSTLPAWGLVRGVKTERPIEEFSRVPINRSNLTLSVVNATESTTTVRVTLRDGSTGDPINTARRDGYVTIADRRVNTTENGTAVVTLTRPPGGFSAHYKPGAWWRNSPGYTWSSDTVAVSAPVLGFLYVFYRVGVPIGLFLLGAFLIDRIAGWRSWPPWRNL